MLWPNHESRMLVAGHRGERFNAPENTMTSFRRAMDAGVDMIETDVRMTADHELVLIHDARVDRTTDGSGRVADMTLEAVRSLNAAADFEDFARESVPMLDEFLAMCAASDDMLIDLELKDYPTPGNEAFAFECADRTIARLEAYGLGERCVLNSFSGRLLEYIDERYAHRYRLHGYYPYILLDGMTRDPRSLLYCLCISSQKQTEQGEMKRFNFNVPPKAYFDAVRADGIEPWVCAGIYSEREICRCVELGASLITTDYPADVLRILRKHGYHD